MNLRELAQRLSPLVEHRDRVGIIRFPLLQPVPEFLNAFAEPFAQDARDVSILAQCRQSRQKQPGSRDEVPLGEGFVDDERFVEALFDQVAAPRLTGDAEVTLGVFQLRPHRDQFRSSLFDPRILADEFFELLDSSQAAA